MKTLTTPVCLNATLHKTAWVATILAFLLFGKAYSFQVVDQVFNGSFEEGTTVPDSWFAGQQSTNGIFEWATTGQQTGLRCYKVTNQVEGQYVFVNSLYGWIRLIPGKTYQLAYSVKGNVPLRCFVGLGDPNGNFVYPSDVTVTPNPNGYTEYVNTFTAPPNNTAAIITFYTAHAGQFWLDDVRLIVDPSTVDYYPEAYYNPSTTDRWSTMSRLDPWGDGSSWQSYLFGKIGRNIVGVPNSHCLYLRLPDSYRYGGIPNAAITVEYADIGTDTFGLDYDAAGPWDGAHVFKLAGVVTKQNTGTWKRKTFYVSDAYFGGRQGGADFRIGDDNDGGEVIGYVSVTPWTPYSFNGSMTKDVLLNYLSHTVTLEGLCIEGWDHDPAFNEDMRMLTNIGAKYVARAASYSWTWNIAGQADVDRHFASAAAYAKEVHAIDPEIALEAAVYEIAFVLTVNNTRIPAYVFEAFNQPVVERNFDASKLYPAGGTIDGVAYNQWYFSDGSAVLPQISQLETQMYYYYNLTRYIDAGYEVFHTGDTEFLCHHDSNDARYFGIVVSKAREYAKKYARRGMALFCGRIFMYDNNSNNAGSIKNPDGSLVHDFNKVSLVPTESVTESGAMKAYIMDYQQQQPNKYTWLGRSTGGLHPLGFYVDANPTVMEYDNSYVDSGYGVATPVGYGDWGFDDITWNAYQPGWYRGEFLTECQNYLKTHLLDSNGKQVYFVQLPCREWITPFSGHPLALTYSGSLNQTQLANFAYSEGWSVSTNGNGSFALTAGNAQSPYGTTYCSNMQSNTCPTGFGDEIAYKKIFSGSMGNYLPSGGVMYPDQYLVSLNNRYRFYHQYDSNLVVYDTWTTPWTPLWASYTPYSQSFYVVLQSSDGNLCEYNANGGCLWDARTSTGYHLPIPPNRAEALILLDNGKLVIVDSTGRTIWSVP